MKLILGKLLCYYLTYKELRLNHAAHITLVLD